MGAVAGKVYRGDYWSDRGVIHVLGDDSVYPLPRLTRPDGKPVHSHNHGWGYHGQDSLQLAHDLLADVYGQPVPRAIYDPLSESPLMMQLSGSGPWELTELQLRDAAELLARHSKPDWLPPTPRPRHSTAAALLTDDEVGFDDDDAPAAVAPPEPVAVVDEEPAFADVDFAPEPVLVAPPPAPETEAVRPEVTIWTDGATRSNPGRGGYGALLVCGDLRREVTGGHPETTNNQMELMAAIAGLEALKCPCRVTVITDSQYLQRSITQYIERWIGNGWRNAKGKPVANQGLWMRLSAAMEPHEVEWRWVRGHNGDAGNEAADGLANRGLQAVEQGELEPCLLP